MTAILLIEDSQDYRSIISGFLETNPSYRVTAVPTPHDAFEALGQERFGLIICDLHLPFILDERMKQYPYSVEVGVKTLEEFRKVLPEMPLLAITAAMESDRAMTSRIDDVIPVLHKPFSCTRLFTYVDALLGSGQHNGVYH